MDPPQRPHWVGGQDWDATAAVGVQVKCLTHRGGAARQLQFIACGGGGEKLGGEGEGACTWGAGGSSRYAHPVCPAPLP